MKRILWIAVADARGHLMRAHRARRLLAPAVEVDVVTTSDAGVAFLAALGTPARRLGRGYALAFDAQQHLERGRTHGRLLRYLARDAAGDVLRLRRWAEDYELIVDDALHPATLIASLCFDPYAVPIVHVFGTTLLEAVVEIGGGRRDRLRSRTISTRSPQTLGRSAPSDVRGGGTGVSAALALHSDRAASTRSRPGHEGLGGEVPSGLLARLLERALRRAFAGIEYAVDADPDGTRLRPLVDPPRRSREAVRRELGVRDHERLVVAYLNPHFSDPRLAVALESAPGRLYAVGEGFAGRAGWVAYDGDLADKLAAADVVVSAPGVATLTAVKASGVPYVALRSRQPEQRNNLARLGRDFEVVDVTTPELLPAAIERARRASPGEPVSTIAGDWRRTLHLLIDERNHRCAPALHWSSKPTT